MQLVEGVCLPCGDSLMTLEKIDLLKALAKAVAEVKRLESLHKGSDTGEGK